MSRIFRLTRALCLAALAAAASSLVVAQEPAKETPAAEKPLDMAKLHKQFAEAMNGVKLVGRFTITGKDDRPPAQEEYTIKSVKKLEEGDYWLFNARIKYGQNDATVPLPLEVKWAGDTPVITLTNLTIPGLGTFSSRVVIDGQRYAGTWQHGQVGGHLFGMLEKLPAESKPEKKE